MPDTISHGSTATSRGFAALYIAWAIALAATLGALFIGEVLGQAPCHLCWYQRIAMFPLALILGLATLSGDLGTVSYTHLDVYKRQMFCRRRKTTPTRCRCSGWPKIWNNYSARCWRRHF